MSPSNSVKDNTEIRKTTLIYLTAISAGILLISNLAATKLWDMFGIAVDGGVICFPISYILGDIIIEFYGKKTAKSVILSSLLLNILAAIVFWIVCILPPFAGTEEMHTAISSVLGFAPRIIIGSLAGYLFSQQLHLRENQEKDWFKIIPRSRSRILSDCSPSRHLGLRDYCLPWRLTIQ